MTPDDTSQELKPHPAVRRVADVRAEFPALAREEAGRTAAYFDGPGGTQVPAGVAEAVADYLLRHNANAGWNYATSRETDGMLEHARSVFASFFRGRADEVVFGANMTTLTLRLAHALGRRLRPGDEIVVTELDHHANVDTWKALAADRGLELRVARVDARRGTLDMAHLQSLIGERTRVLAIGAASNAIGTITDVTTAAGWAHAVGATVFVDAVHYAPHALPDVHALDADFLAVSAYKFYGPHVGVLWGRAGLLDELDVPRVSSAPESGPRRVESGTQCFEGIAGAAAAVEWLASLAEPGAAAPAPDALRGRLASTYAALHERAAALFARLWHGLRAIDGVRVFGLEPGARRTATVCFTVDGVAPADAAGALSERGVFVTHGDFYAPTLVRRLGCGRSGMLRAGCAAYTTEEEVDRLIEGVGALRPTA